MAHLTDREGHSVSKAEVKHTLDAILRSPGFESSPQLSDFLRYIVEETLAGRQNEIKAYSIAVDALGKGEEFDPQENAAVRVAAGRLRQNLTLYNTGPDASSAPLMITLEAGSYVPIFVRLVHEGTASGSAGEDESDVGITDAVARNSGAVIEIMPEPPESGTASTGIVDITRQSEQPDRRQPVHLPTFVAAVMAALLVSLATASFFFWGSTPSSVPEAKAETSAPPKGSDRKLRPGMAAFMLFPDKSYPAWFPVGAVADSLAVTLARFDGYEFFGVTTAREFQTTGNLDADFTLMVSGYNRGSNVRIFAQLIRGRDGVVLWSTQRLFSEPQGNNVTDGPAFVGRILAPVLSPYGLVYNDLLSGDEKRFEMRCFISAYQYFYKESDERHAQARECAERLIEQGSRLPSVYAALTFLYLDEYRENRNRRERDPLKAAERMAERAVQLGPLSARAHQAAFAVHKVRGRREQARLSGRQAVKLNPYDTDIMADYAAWLISIGDTKAGNELLQEALALLQSRPAWVDFYRFLVLELSDELQRAAEVAATFDVGRSPLLAVASAIGAHRTGKPEETKRALQEIRRVEPGMADDPAEAFLRRGFDTSIAESLAKKLSAAEHFINSLKQN